MKKTMITVAAAFIVMETMVASVEEANAVVYARGVYRAACAGPRGAVVARRPVVVPRRVVVAPRGVVVRRPIY